MPILSIFVSFGLFYFLTKSFKELFGGRINLSTENTIAMTVSYYVLVDFLSYWGHRIFHAVPCLWVLHKYHHSAPEMNMLNKYRTHPMYEATASVMSLPLIFLGASPEPIVAFNLLILAHTLLLHSNFKSNWGWFGKWVVFSPAAHRLHHSTSEAHFGKNLGSLLPIWDHMFGTAMHPTDHESHNIKIGLSDDPGDAPSFHYIWTVYKEFFINIYGQLVSRLCGKTT
jgi:sterol desaturase/sphingolipid hydroxylase (fatty acid hydroxylase superfamily)